MSVTYHGVELVNCRPPCRKGPLQSFPSGQYKGSRVEDVIRRDPRYFMWAVKEWLNISPSQAFLFEEVTGGGIIPDTYIVEEKKSPLPEVKDVEIPGYDPGAAGVGGWVHPDYDFDPQYAPAWWPEFKRRSEGLTPIKTKDLYEEMEKKYLDSLMKEWHKEYYEYRHSHSKK